MAHYRSFSHITSRLAKITSLLAQGKDNALTVVFERDKPLASLVVQDITFESLLASSPQGNAISVEYVAGGTAGAEVVTVIGTKISIQIEDGVSTATQVKAAFDGESEATDIATATITGTAGDPQDAAVETNLVNPATLNFRINSEDMTSIDMNANAGADIEFNYPDDNPGSETFTIVKTDILLLKRLRTKKYLIDASVVGRATIV